MFHESWTICLAFESHIRRLQLSESLPNGVIVLAEEVEPDLQVTLIP